MSSRARRPPAEDAPREFSRASPALPAGGLSPAKYEQSEELSFAIEKERRVKD